MVRSIRTHHTQDYNLAAIEAYDWVRHHGGTLIFSTIQLRDMWLSSIRKEYGEAKVKRILAEPRVQFGIARGQRYSLMGPVIAIIDGTDLEMKRLKADVNDAGDFITEIRSYTKAGTLDTHKEWTKEHQVQEINV